MVSAPTRWDCFLFRIKSHAATPPASSPSPPRETPTATPVIVLLLGDDEGELRVVAAGSVLAVEADAEDDVAAKDVMDELLVVVRVDDELEGAD